jgi:D-tagatose-1,6-bisphosphate aldolase subunit GatZ/KbaZ
MSQAAVNTRGIRQNSTSGGVGAHGKSARTSMDKLRDLLNANRRGKGVGIYAVCSANRFVLESAMLEARADHSLLLIESTSNQVNQFGGYTGHTPEQFVEFVHGIAAEMNFPTGQIILGGDHLGPHVWRGESSAAAMEKAKEMVRGYVRAGFSKIHLDASMPCADDQVVTNRPLADEIVSTRAAELCEAAEEAYRGMGSTAPRPLYVIGTEVPVPGGEVIGSKALAVTKTKDLEHTLSVAEKAFMRRGLEKAWARVVAVVAQPGVEFGDSTVFAYDSKKANSLSRFITRAWSGVYEAHSTDYQTGAALREMVLDHFAILKVGPWLTFAFREAVFALAAVEREWLAGKAGLCLSEVPETMEAAMLENPGHWRNHYSGDERELRIARKYSYSDRARYYWPQATVANAVHRLIHNLSDHPAPLSLLSQYLPRQAEAVRCGTISNEPRTLIHHKILEVLKQYAYACGLRQ